MFRAELRTDRRSAILDLKSGVGPFTRWGPAMTTASSKASMLLPTTIAGVLGAVLLGFAVMAVPADAGSSAPLQVETAVTQ